MWNLFVIYWLTGCITILWDIAFNEELPENFIRQRSDSPLHADTFNLIAVAFGGLYVLPLKIATDVYKVIRRKGKTPD